MPELPEVESVVRSLVKHVTGDVIESAWFSEKPQTFKCSPQQIAAAIEGARIDLVHRQGKHIIIDLESGNGASARAQWIVHLGMTGKMLVTRPEDEIEKHTHVIASLRSGREIRFIDPRRFGRTWVVTDEARFEAGGSEPLDIAFDDFARLFRGRKTPIKSALLNQKLLRGVGNIYADESLFRAGIRPRRRASSITHNDLRRLHESVQQVLKDAIAAGGSSVSDYVNAEGSPGFFQVQHRVYDREGEPCVVCGTPIKRIVVAGRGTHYCPKCQK
jgi:formamidopyrimidine-DNA glycosylase